MTRLDKYPFLKRLIEKWPYRFQKANLKQKEISKLCGLSSVTISRTLNFINKNPKLSTINKVECTLHNLGV